MQVGRNLIVEQGTAIALFLLIYIFLHLLYSPLSAIAHDQLLYDGVKHSWTFVKQNEIKPSRNQYIGITQARRLHIIPPILLE